MLLSSKMAERMQKNLTRNVVALFEERRANEFSKIAADIARDLEARESVKRGLIEIAKGEETFDDIRTKVSAVELLQILGFAKDVDVQRTMFQVFTSMFTDEKLAKLASLDAIPRVKCCGMRCSEMMLLQALLRGMLYMKVEPGLTAAERVSEVFAGTRFGGKVADMLNE